MPGKRCASLKVATFSLFSSGESQLGSQNRSQQATEARTSIDHIDVCLAACEGSRERSSLE